MCAEGKKKSVYSVEVRLQLSGYVNCQNSRFWSADMSLHGVKVCNNVTAITGPVPSKTTNSHHYVTHVLTPFFGHLSNCRTYAAFSKMMLEITSKTISRTSVNVVN